MCVNTATFNVDSDGRTGLSEFVIPALLCEVFPRMQLERRPQQWTTWDGSRPCQEDVVLIVQEGWNAMLERTMPLKPPVGLLQLCEGFFIRGRPNVKTNNDARDTVRTHAPSSRCGSSASPKISSYRLRGSQTMTRRTMPQSRSPRESTSESLQRVATSLTVSGLPSTTQSRSWGHYAVLCKRSYCWIKYSDQKIMDTPGPGFSETAYLVMLWKAAK
jgi:hypothetical protein